MSLVCIVSIVAAKFRVSLSNSFALAVGVFGQVAHDGMERIIPLLKSMNSQYNGPGVPNAVVGEDGEDSLTATTIDALAAHSVPLYMYQLHSGLKCNYKLKHRDVCNVDSLSRGTG